MKRHLPLAALLVLAFATFCLAQPQATPSPSPSPKPKPKMTKAQLLKKLSANETALWNAWKNKDAKPFQNWLAADGVMIGEEGVGTKQDVLQMMGANPCEIKAFTLSDWKLSMVDPNTAVVTYKGVADGTCGGQPVPPVWASSLWINRKGKWMAFTHQESNIKTQ
jgi:Domain of unknown function (DUF4440)